ncbi:MAG: peptidoglycan DD-metalloendopeptidase family protein [Desulfotignum balticum]|uniref:Peptidoglycan DD-metalloendopeptidase family protein n=1 Tax=Desulfotignum balticum TaxID=115781 RepID=A0A931CV85_9BACT|nr:peptidoglycan DD-metalloendopeptidase family protein [Desulfotignum balticum]
MKNTDFEKRRWETVAQVLGICGMIMIFFCTSAFSLTPKLQGYLIDPNEINQIHPVDKKTIAGVFKTGDTASTVLKPYLPLKTIFQLEKQSRPIFPFTRFKAGRPFSVTLFQGDFSEFEYEIDARSRLVIQKTGNQFDVIKTPIQYEIKEETIRLDVESNISTALKKAGYCPSLAWELSDIFAWDIDFAKDIQTGDRFQLLVEKQFRHGEYKGYGQVLAAVFVNNGSPYRAFRYTDTKGRAGYYDEKGKSLHKSFLKSPVNYSRISSYFSNSRLHPILKVKRPHPGIDYSAPKNTPIKTVADGVIREIAYNKTMGRYITIQHINGYETSYLHMNSFAKGMKKGGSVSQGDVIGYVGKTGLATGYHLDFRMTKNGRHINPLDTPKIQVEPIPEEEMDRFENRVAEYVEKLTDGQSVALSSP